MAIEVIRPGQLTTVQDLGRPGWRKYGVMVGGAMDADSLRIANLLVGNEVGAAGLEMTLVGPSLRFETDQLLAVCGGDFSPQVGKVLVPAGRPVWIRAGSELHFAAASQGCRAYLAVAGGLDVPVVLGGRGTCLRTGMGGYMGRSLRSGDRLELLTASSLASRLARTLAADAGTRPVAWPHWSAAPFAGDSEITSVRVLAGRHATLFSGDDREQFTSATFTASDQSDRTGYRLEGPRLRSAADRSLLSEGMVPGAVQVPPAGNPIVLMADGPVTGGYPVIGQVIDVDLPQLAQLRPGSCLRFQSVTLLEARSLYLQRESNLSHVRVALALRS